MRIASALLLLAMLSSACGNVISRKYEYEEELFLALDGSARLYVNASVPALVALRGADLPVDSTARLDRQRVRDFFEHPASHVVNVTTSRRDNRRYVHVRLDVPDVRKLADAPAFQWSAYGMTSREGLYEYTQIVRAVAGKDVGHVGWTGRELVAFRLHLPSKVPFHNSPSRTIERGNIIIWEQPLADRLTGVPVDIDVRMETSSILTRTLTLFVLMAVAVALTFAAAIWFVRRQES